MADVHPTRALIAKLFSDGRERTFSDVCTAMEAVARSDRATVRYHLSEMRKMGLLKRFPATCGISLFRPVTRQENPE